MLAHRSATLYGGLEPRGRSSSDDEGERLLLREGDTPPDWEAEGLQHPEPPSEAQEGVRMIEAVNLTWTARSLCVAYIRSVHPGTTMNV